MVDKFKVNYIECCYNQHLLYKIYPPPLDSGSQQGFENNIQNIFIWNNDIQLND
mgnify:CR=1 FL=1